MKTRLFILLSLTVVLALLVPGVAVPTAAQSQPRLLAIPVVANPPTTAAPPTDAVNGLPNRLNGHVPAFNPFNPFPKSVDSTTGTTTRVSVASDGSQGNDWSQGPSISADGRYVAFHSDASNLVSGDTNFAGDVFVHDRQTGQTTRVSVASDGSQGNGASGYNSISADGRYVAFFSYASNLVSGDSSGEGDVFVHDRQTGQTVRVSVASDGSQGNDRSWYPSISADGRYVAFCSSASNLVSGDTNYRDDVFVHDRQTGQTTRVSVASDGTQGNDASRYSSISADGRYVAFDSWASNLVSGDTNGEDDVFVHDRQTGQTARVSVASDGSQGNDDSWDPSISADGRYVAFYSSASNMVSGDTNGVDDVFVHNRQTGQTTRVSVASDGSQGNDDARRASISADGRYVAFESHASNMVSGDTNGEIDVFVHDRGDGGPSGPTLSASPPSVLANGVSTSTVTLSNVPVGHQVRVLSSRESVDTFASASGTVASSGQFVTTIRSSTPGTAIITAQDLTTGQTFATSASVTFTPVGGGPPPPPPQTGDFIITDVEGDCGQVDCPVDGFFMLGLDGLLLPLRVTVDWKGNSPEAVEFSVNGHTDSIAATGGSVHYELDVNRYLREGSNVLRIVARSDDKSSTPFDLYLTGYRLPQWIMDGVNALPTIGNQALVLEMAFPGQPLCKHEQGRPKSECEEFQWGFIPGDLNHFQWQTNINLTLPTRGGAFAVQISRERDHASTGRKPKAFLKLIGHEFDLEYHGRLSGVLGSEAPYVIVQELEPGCSISTEFGKDAGVVEVLYALPPFGVVAAQALSAVPPIRDWLNDRAKVYIKITPELSGHFTLAFQPGFHVANAGLGLDIPMELGAKADLWVVEGHIYGGLGGEGTFGYSADDVHIASLRAYGFGGYKFRLTWFSLEDRGEWQLAEWPADSGQMALTFLAPAEAPPRWHLIGHIADEDYAIFHARPGVRQAFAPLDAGPRPTGLAAQTTVTSVLVSNVYTYTEPSLAVDPSTDDALLLWVHDDVAKPVGQSHEIYFSRWNGSSWSTPAGVTDDNFLDGAPKVAWADDGNGVAVWERLNDTLPVTATWDVTTAKKIEIATSVYGPTAGTWSSVALLTINAALDFKPQLAHNDAGNLLAVWRQNEAGLLGGTVTETDRIPAAFYDGGWGTPAVAVDGIPGLVDLAAGYGDGAAMIAYTRYLTPTDHPTPTLQLFTSAWDGATWSTPVQHTDNSLGHRNPQVVYNAANQPLVVWLAGDELRLHNLTSGSTVSLTVESGAAIDEFRVVQDSVGNIAAVFTAQESQRDLYVAFYDQVHDLWGNPTRLTDDRASEAYPSAGLDSTGRLLMSYAATAITSVTRTTTISGTGEVVTFTMPVEGQTDLLTLSHVFIRNLTLTDADLAVSDDRPTPGSNVVFSATVRNSGDLALNGVAVGFYDDDPGAGGNLIGTSSLAAPLAAGFTATLTTTYSVPITGGAHALYAVADPADAIAESNEADNTASLAAFGPDLEIAGAGVDYWGGSEVGLRALIRNVGTSAAPTSTLAFYREALTGTLAVSDTVPTLAAGEAITLTTPWNFALAAGSYSLVAVANQDDFTETFTANNVYTFTLDVGPDLMVSPYYLWTTPLTETTATITATVYNVGPLTATDVTVGFYRRGELDPASLLFTRTVPALSPASEAVITGQVGGPLGCGVYMLADPGRTLTETTRANNLAAVLVEGGRCANFWYEPPSGVDPLTVVFTDTSSGDNTAWLWGFGDGVISTLESPTHVYTAPGTYSVTLHVSGPGGTDEFTRANGVVVYTNTVPALAGLPDQIFDHTTSPTRTLDLWAHASDTWTEVSELTYTIEGTPPAGAGVTLDSNRYVYINPSTDWCGRTDVTIRVTNPGGLWDSDTFRVAVTWSCQG
jgi:PKD repeat protein